MRRGTGISRLTAIGYICFVCIALDAAHADTRNWGGSANGDWFTDGNWTESSVPADGDTVIVSSGSIVLDAPTADLASFTIGSATLVFTNWTTVLNATNITIQSGGMVTHAASATNAVPTNTNRVHIIASNVTVQAGGSIDVSDKGYAGGRYGDIPPIGEGPGGGGSYSIRGGGGAHGGDGGTYDSTYAVGGTAYGSSTAPITLGSGAGGGSGAFGGAGGGAIRIEATGTVTVNGAIIADGETKGDQQASGAGGSIYITCLSMAGSGSLSSVGGSNWNSGGGGGGHIAIDYNPTAQAAAGAPSLTITVAGGTAGTEGRTGQGGTLHFTDTGILNATELKLTGPLSFDTATSWNPASLTITTASPIFPSGFSLDVTGDFKLTGSGKTTLTNAPSLDVGGDLVMTNGGALEIYSPMTNGQAYGMLFEVNGSVSMATGSVLSVYSHPTNGGSIKMVVSNLWVAAGAVVDANSKGYLGSRSPGGYGPGGGSATGDRGGGGGHGGAGGDGNKTGSEGGPAYGSSNAPVQCGSGAGGGSYAGGNGGGLIWVFAQDTIHVDGDLDADGETVGTGDQDGGGAGGGIYLKMTTFSGSGNVVARGGGDGSGNCGGGGGGRIAIVDWTSDSFSGLVSVEPGTFYTTGGTGTLVRTINPLLKSLTVQGIPATHGTPVPWPYGLSGIMSGTETTNTIQQTANVTATTRDLFLTYSISNAAGTVIDSGSATQTAFTVDQDLFLTYVWTNQFYLTSTSGPNGGLQPDRTDWYNDSVQVSVTATAAVDYAFTQWSGLGVPAGTSTNNPLVLTMDQARDVQANFSSTAPTARTWNGVGTWFTSDNWTPTGNPGPNDTLTVNAGTLTIPDPSQAASMTVKDGATLVFTNWTSALSVDSFTVESNGVVTHALCDIGAASDNTNRIHIICTSFTVDEGALIDANAKGYPGGPQDTDGYGPGGGQEGNASAGAGGYGGQGGHGNLSHGANDGGPEYGTATAPTQPGSGGGGAAGGASDDTGGNGGGVIRIEATGAATVNGTLRANGAIGTGSSRYGGGGSGGSIYITCNTFQGDGVLQAVGGDKTYENGGGGGGRIAVAYDSTAQAALSSQPTATFSTRHATTFEVDDLEDGSVFLTDNTFLPTDGAIFPDSTRVYGITNWSITSTTISNRPIRFLETGFNFRATQNLAITGDGGLQFNIAGQTFAIGGNLTLSDGGDLTLISGPTNASGAWSEYGALADMDGTVTITGAGSSLVPVSEGTNGGSIKFELNDIVLASDGAINANGCGFIGAAATYGYGPGSGKGGVNSAGGGGYGGRGGDGNHYPDSEGGPTYGSEAMPLMPGSSGGGMSKGHTGGNGGGLVWIEADTVTINSGAITANGDTSAAGNGGGGSGGAIFIQCETLDGTMGTFDASGADGGGEGGGGGGGRIAIWRYSHGIAATNCTVSAGSGDISDGAASDPGTVSWNQWTPPAGPGTVIMIR